MTSGITRGLPTMVPIAMLYATPEDAANEIAYLYKRHYPISYVEMGEEADGQHMLPEDYAALYVQFATAIHKLVPGSEARRPAVRRNFRRRRGLARCQRKSFLARPLRRLSESHGRLNDFTFFSFEHYPYQDRPTYSWADLYPEPGYVSHIVQVWKDNGLPPNIPFFMTEGNIGGGAPPSISEERPVARRLRRHHDERRRGRDLLFPLHAVPGETGSGFGNFLHIDADYKVLGYPPQYLAAQVITKEWVQPIDAPHKQFKAASDVNDAAGNVLVTAYAVERPDGQWSVMLVNRDQSNDHAVKVAFAGADRRMDKGVEKKDRHFTGQVDRITFGSNEYQWHIEGARGHADPDGPPSKSKVEGSADALYQIPKASITVLRGRIGE